MEGTGKICGGLELTLTLGSRSDTPEYRNLQILASLFEIRLITVVKFFGRSYQVNRFYLELN